MVCMYKGYSRSLIEGGDIWKLIDDVMKITKSEGNFAIILWKLIDDVMKITKSEGNFAKVSVAKITIYTD